MLPQPGMQDSPCGESARSPLELLPVVHIVHITHSWELLWVIVDVKRIGNEAMQQLCERRASVRPSAMSRSPGTGSQSSTIWTHGLQPQPQLATYLCVVP